MHHYSNPTGIGSSGNNLAPLQGNYHNNGNQLIHNQDPQPLSVSSHALSIPIEPPLTTRGVNADTTNYIRDGLRNHGHNTNPLNVDPLLPGSSPNGIYAPDSNYLSNSIPSGANYAPGVTSTNYHLDPLSDNTVRRTIGSSNYGSLNEITNHERNQYARNFAGEDGKLIIVLSLIL